MVYFSLFVLFVVGVCLGVCVFGLGVGYRLYFMVSWCVLLRVVPHCLIKSLTLTALTDKQSQQAAVFSGIDNTHPHHL